MFLQSMYTNHPRKLSPMTTNSCSLGLSFLSHKHLHIYSYLLSIWPLLEQTCPKYDWIKVCTATHNDLGFEQLHSIQK